MANKIKLDGTTANSFQIGKNGPIFTNDVGADSSVLSYSSGNVVSKSGFVESFSQTLLLPVYTYTGSPQLVSGSFTIVFNTSDDAIAFFNNISTEIKFNDAGATQQTYLMSGISNKTIDGVNVTFDYTVSSSQGIYTGQSSADNSVLIQGGSYLTPTSLTSDISKVKITGGNIGQVLSTDGTGNLSWSPTIGLDVGALNVTGDTINGVSLNLLTEFGSIASIGSIPSTVEPNITKSSFSLAGVNSQNNNRGSTQFMLNDDVVNTGIDLSFVLPANVGTTGQVLSTDGTGNLSWVDQSGGGSGGNVFTGDVTINGGILNTEYGIHWGPSAQGAVRVGYDNDGLGLGTHTDVQIGGSYTRNDNSGFAQNSVVIRTAPLFDLYSSQYTLTLPKNAGINGQVMSTNGEGTLSWVDQPTVPPAVTPGGSNTYIQFNNDGVFGGVQDLTFIQVDNITDAAPKMILGNSAVSIDPQFWNGANLVLKSYKGQTEITRYTGIGLTITDTDTTGFGGDVSAINLVANTITLGSNANINITGGSSGQVLTTDGAGNLSWTTAGGSSTTDFTPSFLLGGM